MTLPHPVFSISIFVLIGPSNCTMSSPSLMKAIETNVENLNFFADILWSRPPKFCGS